MDLVLVHLETVLVLVQDRCTLCAKRTRGSEVILDALHGSTRCRGQVKLISVLSDIVLILTQDMSTVCVVRTIGSEIILDTLYGTPR